MPIGGKLLLKGGVPLKGSVKKTKHKKAKQQVEAADSDDEQQQQANQDAAQAPGAIKKVAPTAINVMSGKSYEQEFDLEVERMKKPKVKSTPWGSSYRQAPDILHGYSSKVTGNTASERLDMRAATKADKFCK